MRVLVINSGSSSIKYRLLDGPDLDDVATGLLERIGGPTSRLVQRWTAAGGSSGEYRRAIEACDHKTGLEAIFEALADKVPGGSDFDVVAHRVVHGGEHYSDAVVVDDTVVDRLRSLIPLAPLHNAANLVGIEVTRALRPRVPQVAVFDTAFHQTMPPEAYLYAVPRAWYERFQVRRYGFHGSSHRYVATRAAQQLGKALDTTSLIVLHLGNGASAAAIRNGRSVDTSMGMTPLEGLVMGTRSGDVDPSILLYMQRSGGLDAGALESTLNRESGLMGLAGVSDMRDVIAKAAEGDDWAGRAMDVYCYRVRKYIGAYMAVLGEVDALVFTGGVGENRPDIRSACVEGLDAFGFRLDPQRNRNAVGRDAAIGEDGSGRAILVIPTNEEWQIAREALELLGPGEGDGKSMKS